MRLIGATDLLFGDTFVATHVAFGDWDYEGFWSKRWVGCWGWG